MEIIKKQQPWWFNLKLHKSHTSYYMYIAFRGSYDSCTPIGKSYSLMGKLISVDWSCIKRLPTSWTILVQLWFRWSCVQCLIIHFAPIARIEIYRTLTYTRPLLIVSMTKNQPKMLRFFGPVRCGTFMALSISKKRYRLLTVTRVRWKLMYKRGWTSFVFRSFSGAKANLN